VLDFNLIGHGLKTEVLRIQITELTDAVRGVTKEIYSDLTAAEGTNPDGF
jgi:hypothetical protein